jgi:molecular chaperone DnaJ
MASQDYYSLLGVNKNASADEIKKSYRKMAMQYHPDRNPGNKDAEQKFREISKAYETLKDDQKKAAYDRYGHDAYENRGASSGVDPSANFSDIFGDLFGDFMGGGRSRQTGVNNRGSDLRYNLETTLEEAFSGKQQKIQFTTAVACDSCLGSGSKNSSKPSNCHTCSGNGKIRMQQGFFTIEKTCTACGGMGQTISDPCHRCAGEGRIRKEKTLSVNIPEGVEDGTRIRLSGEGEVGIRNGTSGDLYIFISVKEHEFFVREGNNIHCRIPIKMSTAALGGDFEVPIIDGTRAKFNIPQGTQSDDKFRLKGKGMPIMRTGGRRGDMYIHCNVEIPVKLTKKQKDLLKEFDELDDSGTNPKVDQFLNKVKSLWKDA